MCIDLHQPGTVGEGSDHLQLIKFWPSCAPGKGVCGGAKILLQPAGSVCVSPSLSREQRGLGRPKLAQRYPTSYVTRTPLSRSKGQRSRSPGRFTHRRIGASGSCSGGRGNVLAVRNCCYVAICSAARGTSAPTGGGEGLVHIVAAARLQLVLIY